MLIAFCCIIVVQILHTINYQPMNPTQQRFIIEYLQKLGYEEEVIHLFLTLLEAGPVSYLQASRLSGIERTKIYRMVEVLSEKGIIELIVEDKRTLLQAADVQKIQLIVENERLKTEELSKNFPTFQETIRDIAYNSPSSQVRFYRGKEGIKQMLWNELDAQGESVCFIYKIFDPFVGTSFFDKWVVEFNLRNLTSRELRTEIFDKSYQEHPNELCFTMRNIEIRYLPSKILPITQSMSVYNNVVSIYNWWHNEIFGIEIYNQQFANFQRFFFETVWKKGKPRTRTHLHTQV